MPRHSPYWIELSSEERAVLESLARSYTLPYWQVVRAQMVLMAADGMRNDQIAARLRCGREVVSQWRKRFFEQRLAGLEDRPRRGRPPAFPPQVRAELIAMACALPAEHEVYVPTGECSRCSSGIGNLSGCRWQAARPPRLRRPRSGSQPVRALRRVRRTCAAKPPLARPRPVRAPRSAAR